MSWIEDIIAMRALASGVESTPRRAKWDFGNVIITDDPATGKKLLTVSVPPDTTISETLKLTGALTPAQITATQNDYNPTGLADALVLRLSTDARRLVTGIAGGSAGRVLRLDNVGSFPIALAPNSTASSAANRVLIPSGSGATEWDIFPGESYWMWWDITANRWRLLNQHREVFGSFSLTTSPSADVNNAGRFGATYVRFSPQIAVVRVTGIDGTGTDREELEVGNVNTTNYLVLVHESSSSTAANRFNFANGKDIILSPGDGCALMRDESSARWRPRTTTLRTPEPLHGAELTGAAGTPGQTITVDQGAVRTLLTQLAQNSTLDIDNTNAVDDETITIVSLNSAAFTYTIRDHSNATIFTIPASTRMMVRFKKATGANFAGPFATRI